MQPKTLLHVFPTFALGGAQTRFTSIANHLGAQARHIVVSLDGRMGAREKLNPGLDVTFIDAGQGGGTLGGIWRAARFLRGARADCLITSNWGSMDWAAASHLAELTHVHTEDGFGPDEAARQIPRRVLARRLLLRRGQVVLPSRTLLRVAAETWRLPRARLRYIPNGIDINHFADATPAELPASGAKVIGTVAILRPEKNLARLITAFAGLPPGPLLVIVGDGPERPALASLASSLGVAGRVVFAGHTREARHFLAAFDIFALSSDTEQMPISVLEAMAAGLPVVATDVGDVRDMLAAENAPFVVAKDAQAMTRAMTALLAHDDLARDVGRANRARAAAQFSQAPMFAAWREVLGIQEGSVPCHTNQR